MGLFSALVGVVIETAKLPMDVVVDVVTLGGTADGEGSRVVKRLEEIKEEAEKADG